MASLRGMHMHRILIVDDEPEVAKALRRLLTRRGFETSVALDAGEALESLSSFRPNAVLSDLRMPGPNGLELLAEVKRRAPQTACLLLTGCADLEDLGPGVEAHGLLGKPWDPDVLVAALRGAIEGRAPDPAPPGAPTAGTGGP